MLSLITEFVLRLAYWRKPTSFSAPSKAHSSQLLLPHSHPRRLSESSCTETTCSFSTVCITLPQKIDKVNRNFSCLIRFLQKSLRLSCQLFYTTPTFFIPHQRSAAPVSAAPATKPAKTLGFRRFSFCMCCMVIVFTLVQTVGCRFRLHLSSSSFIPSSTQNTPDFGGFHLKSGAFHCFFLFWTCEIWGPVFVHCADMPHRLKPSVIPCRREVSFLT